MRRRPWWLLAVIAVIGAGCGKPVSDNAADYGGLTIPTTAASQPAQLAQPVAAGSPVTVQVKAGDYDFHSTLATFTAGVTYHFEVTNVGAVAHEFMVGRPIAAGTMGMEEMDAMAVGHIEEVDLPAGATASVDVTFDKANPAGALEISCHIGQHYEKGMHLPIVVEAAAQPVAAGSPVTVQVKAGDYDFHSTLATFTAGATYHFEVTNVGAVAHEFMVGRPIAAGTMGMEEMDAMAVGHIEEVDLPAGATASVDVTFDKAYPAGTLEISCHIGQHYEKGMHLPIVVE